MVSGSGVVVIGPLLPTGVQGMFAGQLGGGVVGILVTMQLSVRQLVVGWSQFCSWGASCASAVAADTTASETTENSTRLNRFTGTLPGAWFINLDDCLWCRDWTQGAAFRSAAQQDQL